MRTHRTETHRLDDIHTTCALIVDRMKGKQFPEFAADIVLQDSVIRRLEIIGEASKNLSDSTRKKYPEVEWKGMMKLRDRAAHGYWTIDALKLWDIVHNDIPRLLELLS